MSVTCICLDGCRSLEINTLKSLCSDTSFTYNRKHTEPKIYPCGTPLTTCIHSDTPFLRITC